MSAGSAFGSLIRMGMGRVAAAQGAVELTHVGRLQAWAFGAGRLATGGFGGAGLGPRGLSGSRLVAPGLRSAWGVHRLGTRLVRVHRLWARDLRIEGVRSVGHRAIELAHVRWLESSTGGGGRPT